MITAETIEKLSRQYHMSVFPNIIREYFQHVFMEQLYTQPGSEKVLFKGGTALRIVYGSPRFSEDLDFSLIGIERHEVTKMMDDMFVKVLLHIEQIGIRVVIGDWNPTSGGYFGVATFHMLDYQPVNVELNMSTRHSRDLIRGEVDSVANDFVPTYTVVHLPQQELVEEKIFGALRERKKPRDYYDLYFMMRQNMLSAEQKKRLAAIKAEIALEAEHVDFRSELGAFLPVSQQNIIRDFGKTLAGEMNRQLGSV